MALKHCLPAVLIARRFFGLGIRPQPGQTRFIEGVLICGVVLLQPTLAWAAQPGLPLLEDFSTTSLNDSARSSTNWSVQDRKSVV